MNSLLVYLVKVNVVFTVLFLAYYLLLRKEKFFQLNRLVLLGILCVSFVSPLIPTWNSETIAQLQTQVPVVHAFQGFYEEGEQLVSSPSVKEVSVPKRMEESERVSSFSIGNYFSYRELLLAAYGIVVVILFLRLLYQLSGLLFMFWRHPRRTTEDGIHYYEHEHALSPFSFFHHLFVNATQFTPEQLRQVVAHEKIHIRQWHSVDILVSELAFGILWINPLVYSFKRHVKLNLEYLADASVLAQGVDKKKYQLNILQSCLNPDLLPLTNLFNSSKLKLRIKMMNARKSPSKNLYKYALVLPLLALIYFVINPSEAKNQTTYVGSADLKSFEGYYQFQKDKKFYLHVTTDQNNLILNQMWDGKAIPFKRKGELEFSGQDGTFPLSFEKSKEGSIVKLIAFERDVWNKVDHYVNGEPIKLTEQELKKFEGYYQFKNEKGAYVKFSIRDGQLIGEQVWDHVEHVLVPYAEYEFKTKEKGIPVTFLRDANGNVNQVYVLNNELLDKVDEYKPVERKIVQLSLSELKAVEGYYQFEAKKDYYVQVYAKGNSIVLKQMWNLEERTFDPESALTFAALMPTGRISFQKDAQGNVTEMTSLGNAKLIKVKDYKPKSN